MPGRSEADVKDVVIRKLSDRGFPSHVKSPDTLIGYEKEHYIRGRKYYETIDNPKTGYADIIYWYGDEIISLVETKKEGRFSSEDEVEQAFLQAKSYAYAEEFRIAPPFIIVSDGEDLRIWKRQSSPVGQVVLLNDEVEGNLYEAFGIIPPWDECVQYEVKGEFEKDYVQVDQLNSTFLTHFDEIRNDLQYAYRQLDQKRRERLDELIARRLPGDREERLDLYLTNSVLNLINKILFLKVIEARDQESLLNLFDFVHRLRPSQIRRDKRILLYPAIFRIRWKERGLWTDSLNEAWATYVSFYESANDFSIVSLLYAAFEVEATKLPGIYRTTYYDFLKPHHETLDQLIAELVKVKISIIPDKAIGETYQEFLKKQIVRRRELGSYYTPEEVCRYLVSRAELSYEHRVMECAVGTGHILAMVLDEMLDKYVRAHANPNWLDRPTPFENQLGKLRNWALGIVAENVFAGDIDTFAIQLTWVRMYLTGFQNMALNIRQRDYLARRERIAQALERATDIGTERDLGHLNLWDAYRFDRIIANPPYGTEPPERLRREYTKIYRNEEFKLGSNDSYGFFLARAISDLEEGGKLYFIVSDTFLTIVTHIALRNYILENCKILEITLMPSDVFKPFAQTATTCIIILEKCSGDANARKRQSNRIQVSRNLRSKKYWSGTPGSSNEMRIAENVVSYSLKQSFYYDLAPRFPFFIPYEDDIGTTGAGDFQKHISVLKRAWDPADETIRTLANVTDGGAGLQTGANTRFVRVLQPESVYNQTISESDLADDILIDWKYRRFIPHCGEIARRISAIFHKQVAANDVRLELIRRYTQTIGGNYVPFLLGGRRANRSYFGRNNFFIEWSAENMKDMLDNASCYPRNMQFYFREGFVTDGIGGNIAARYVEKGVPPVNTNLFCTSQDDLYYVIGLLNSDVYRRLLNIYINSTLIGMSSHVTPEDIRALPYLDASAEVRSKICRLVREIIEAKRNDPGYEPTSEQEQIDRCVGQMLTQVAPHNS